MLPCTHIVGGSAGIGGSLPRRGGWEWEGGVHNPLPLVVHRTAEPGARREPQLVKRETTAERAVFPLQVFFSSSSPSPLYKVFHVTAKRGKKVKLEGVIPVNAISV